MQKTIPDLQDIQHAHERIKPFIDRTPVMTSKGVDEKTGVKVFFKCENFQKVGVFKPRGALNAILQLSDEEKKNGIATHSSGNHGQAIAWASKKFGLKAYIVMPETASRVKVKAVRDFGGEIFFCKPNMQSRQKMLEGVLKKTGAYFIHPYDNYAVIAGQATAGKEFIEDLPAGQAGIPNLDFIFCPIGGGGLISGTALSVHYLSPKTKVIGAEPENADEAFRSFQSGRLQPAEIFSSVADGLLASICEKTFNIIKKYVGDIVTVSEGEILSAMRFVHEQMGLVIEPSSAVAVAGVIKNSKTLKGKKVGVIISGGNVDLEKIKF